MVIQMLTLVIHWLGDAGHRHCAPEECVAINTVHMVGFSKTTPALMHRELTTAHGM